MKFKRYLFLVLILLVLLGISAASAADDSTGDILSTHDNQEIILEESISEDALNENNDEELILEENTNSSLDSAEDELPALNEGETTPGTFRELQDLIDNSETSEITLSKNYTYNNAGDLSPREGIVISRSVSINGNGAVIDGSNISHIFTITANNVKINNITFQNAIFSQDAGGEIFYFDGGAIVWNGAGGNLNNSNFINNRGNDGGAIKWAGADGKIYNSNFNNNTADRYGGAISWTGTNGKIYNSNFNQNNAHSKGGAILWDDYKGTVSNSNFTQNSALFNGGAIYWRDHNGTVNNSNFNDNHVTTIGTTNGKGGAIYWEGKDGVVDKSKFIGNNATNSGGAIYIGDQRNLKANNNIFLNNQDPINTDDALGHNIDYNWFGNVASNYTIKPIDDCNNWLFLNGTANPETMEVFSASEVKFKLFLYTPEGEEGNVTDYDNSQLPAIQLALSSTNGALDKESAGLDEVIKYTSNTTGNGTITAKMDDLEETVALTVNKATTKITAPAVKTTYNIGKYLVITLKDSNGKALSGEKITVTFGKTRTYTTNKNGQVKINIAKYVPKTYNVKINFAGNDTYLNSTKSVKVVVQKAKPRITAKKKTFKRKTKVKKYSIVLKNNKKKALKKMRVTLKVKGKTYKAKTNSKGKAIFKIKNLKKKGKFKAVIKFAGNKYYKKASKKVRITVFRKTWV